MKKCIDRFRMTGKASINLGKTPEVLGEANLAMYASRRRGWQLGISVALGIASLHAFLGNRALGQITPDATLGRENSSVTPNVNVRGLPADLIEGGAARGANLFHSFDQFNVGNGQRVYFANPAGNAWGIKINTGRLVVENGGQVTVSGAGSGLSGNLDVTADSIELRNQGSLRATTNAAEGGNIRLQVADSITMRDNSEIVAEAFSTANGGNITIDAGSFVRAILSENSDIVANAFQGRGGTISAKAQGIFGFRQFIHRRTPESDFSASSEFGINGVVEINTRDKLQNPLPSNFVDASGLIDRHCTPRNRTQERSSFTVTGRGGLPPSPNDPLQGETVVTNWVSLDSKGENNTVPATVTPRSSAPRQLVEAQGWIINEKGQVVLTASAPKVTPQREWLSPPECNPTRSAKTP